MALKQANYVDLDGRHKVVLLPESSEDYEKGVPIGPPSLLELNLPPEIEVRLNNELYHRGILSAKDALRKRPEVIAALQAALRIDAEKILEMYVGKDYRNGTEKLAEEQPNTSVPNRRSRRSR